MKKAHWFIFFFAFPLLLQGQLYDAQWVLGLTTTSPGELKDAMVLDFTSDSLEIKEIRNRFSLFIANTAICNKSGDLQFYSNDCYIANPVHDIMENGDTINNLYVHDYTCGVGSPLGQSVLSLPWPEQANRYVLIHNSHYAYVPVESTYNPGTQFLWEVPLQMTYNEIDMTKNNGLGAVISRNQPILIDTLSSHYLQAVRHANGRDWWIISPVFQSNCYYKTLFTPEGFEVEGKQCIGHDWSWIDASGQSTFSPDGSKYVRFNNRNNLNIFDFDRCTGELFNPLSISFIQDTNFQASVAISPNSRFLYAITSRKVWQYDLHADDIPNSRILIGEYDGYFNNGATYFGKAMLAPDGKIYMAANQLTYNLHVIHHPDSLGLACGLEQHGIELPFLNDNSIPNFPHFRLGALEGSPCDSIVVSTDEEKATSVNLTCFPNPTNAQITFSYSANEHQTLFVQVFDVMGREVADFSLSSKENHRLRTQQYPAGLYFYTAKIEGELLREGRFVVGH